MADNVTLPPTGTGTADVIVATDKIGGIDYQRIKATIGADGTAVDPIPVSNGLDTTATGVQAVGIVAQLDDAATGTVTENQFAPVRLSSRRALLVEGVASGTAQPISLAAGATAIAKAEDVASADADVGVPAMAVRKGTPANTSGTDGDYEFLQMSAGRLWASATIDAALPAGTALVGNTGHKQTRISVTPTVSTSPAYTAKDAVGGIMTFANAVGVSGGTGILQSVTCIDISQQMPTLELALFDQTLGATVTDNSIFDPNDSDLANLIAIVPISAWADFNDNSAAHRGGLGIAFKANATSIFGVLVTRSTPTFVGTSDISVILDIIQNA